MGWSGFSIASLVLGILSIPLGWIPLLGWGLIALSIIFGILALIKISKDSNLKGKGLAIAGIILGGVSLIYVIVLAVFLISGENQFIFYGDANATIDVTSVGTDFNLLKSYDITAQVTNYENKTLFPEFKYYFINSLSEETCSGKPLGIKADIYGVLPNSSVTFDISTKPCSLEGNQAYEVKVELYNKNKGENVLDESSSRFMMS